LENDREKVHPFDRMFFNHESRQEVDNNDNQQFDDAPQFFNEIFNSDILKNIDMDETLASIEKIWDSFQELKPMFQQVTPLFEKFISKFGHKS